jgi:TetR/AcrR family transcriptional regulator, cholesterol catabolism regulator
LRAGSQLKRQQFTSRGELKRTQILDAAAKVLARRGYIGTQLSEIAEEAGTQSGSLYYHFESREELIEEVLQEGVRLSFARARAVVEAMRPEATPLERLAAALRAHLKFQLVESDYARAVSRFSNAAPARISAAA